MTRKQRSSSTLLCDGLDEEKIKKFVAAIEETARYIKSIPLKRVSIVHHNDTDGIASGSILQRAFQREGFEVENIPIERIHPLILPRIHTPERKLVLYADLGGQSIRVIEKHLQPGTSTVVLDHHPSFDSTVSLLYQINPETFGIDGDLNCSAATVVFFLAKALSDENNDLAYLGVLGAIGDHQTVNGKLTGLNQIPFSIAESNGSIRLTGSKGGASYTFALFDGMTGNEVSNFVTELAVNGYYQKGADFAIRACLEGPFEKARQFGFEMKKVQEDRFRKERDRLCTQGIPSEDSLQWVDVEDRFQPLGVKAIGIFCSEISQETWIHQDKYIVGFQDLPEDNPYLGKFEWQETKVSMRVPPVLYQEIEKGFKPDLTKILPIAAEKAEGFADACHRYSAACTLPKKNKLKLIQFLREEINRIS